MTYRWETPDRLVLRPHRSLPKRGFAVVILLFFLLVTVPLYGVIGTRLLWGLLPFAMLALAGLWVGLSRSYADGEITEVLTLTADAAELTRDGPRGAHADWRANPYWVEVQMHETSGPVPAYITLRGAGREVEIGAFLSEEERRDLFPELLKAFRAHRAT